ncbi:uncharacterized protein N7459_003007 [Penicillium hispanicum]|uniref:uncharacterized protein n=1 Tax=Penicillium hispanicum TaxID=1080232 RepID=UPI0025400418|nr:uncharacterized protein N7459_003007 [Penicillium hispanicum]KAJ5587242.1 hypothetical protein N7459_003007 [Penicillium hispanicum]
MHDTGGRKSKTRRTVRPDRATTQAPARAGLAGVKPAPVWPLGLWATEAVLTEALLQAKTALLSTCRPEPIGLRLPFVPRCPTVPLRAGAGVARFGGVFVVIGSPWSCGPLVRVDE